MPKHESVGVIGLGIMGKPMAGRLVEAGFDVTVHSRSPGPVQSSGAWARRAARSAAEVAQNSDVVITILPDTPDVESVLLGADGVLGAARPGALIIDMSTIAPAMAQRVAAEAECRGMQALDAPVSGGEQGAIDGTLSIMCGGSAEAVERARPIFERLGQRIVHVGDAGAGQIVKACNQIVVGVMFQAMAEALVLGGKAGVEPSAIVAALVGGAARCWALEVKAPQVLRRDFRPGFRSRLHHKDLGIALDAAGELEVALPVTASVREFYRSLIAQGRGDYDHSALVTLVEDMAGFKVNGGSPE